jgi:ring-1,2-phenylacetyl-CoA epoxidase subunit PaaD
MVAVLSLQAEQRARIDEILETVMDPEVPVLSVVELGVVRNVVIDDDLVRVSMTPTYSGCPALERMREDITSALVRGGFLRVEVEIVFAPAWTTDWMSDAAKAKLKAYGIAPPNPTCGGCALTAPDPEVQCPQCDGDATEMRSAFGSTACKALYYCRGCQEPFEYFKAF